MRNREKFYHLQQVVSSVEHADYPFQSRVHALRSLPRCFVKRDDELGFGISGSKFRKFRTLIPYLVAQGLEIAVVVGGAYSNNVMGIVQLLVEKGIKPVLFLRGEPTTELQGNFLLIRLMVGCDAIQWVSRQDWSHVDKLAECYAESQRNLGKKSIVIPEGSVLPDALPGLLTLPLDIVRNEEEQGIYFDNVFIDAGTGMTAAAVISAFAWMEIRSKVHVILLADDENVFKEKLRSFHSAFEKLLRQEVVFPDNFVLHRPIAAPSFGSVNSEILKMIRSLAQNEGFFVDPIYTAKLFLTGQKIMERYPMNGNSLIVHSGGGLGLNGYQKQLMDILK